MLWNYLQQIKFHLHSSISKYIVKTFVIFAPLPLCTERGPGHTHSYTIIFGTFLSDWIARFWKYCLIHSRLRTVCVCFPFPVFPVSDISIVQQDKHMYEQIMKVKGRQIWKRCVLYMEQQRLSFRPNRKRLFVLKASVPLRTNCPRLHLARVHIITTVTTLTSTTCYCTLAFLWQSPRSFMQATKIDFKNKRFD